MATLVERLLPCPFCGFDRPVLKRNGIGDSYVQCTSDDLSDDWCGASSSDYRCETDEGAIARWNKRTPAAEIARSQMELTRQEILAGNAEGERKIAQNKLVKADAEITRLEAECFKLAAGVCPHQYGDDHGHSRCTEIDRLQAELDAKGEREMKVRWEDLLDQRFPIAVAFVGSFKVGATEQASTNNKLWHTYVGLERLDSFVELSDARAAVEVAALSALCGGTADV